MLDIHEAITKVMQEFKENPLIIHSEADIQAQIYSALISQEITQENKGLIETKNKLDGKRLKTNRVHCEYQGTKKEEQSGSRKKNLIDIVVFSEEGTKMIENNKQLLFTPKGWGLTPCETLIQIKFENGQRGNSEEVKNDFKILQEGYKMHVNNVKPNLYFVYFIFYPNISPNNKIFNLLKELPDLSDPREGRKVDTYLTIGPKNIWQDIINNLDIDFGKIFLEYTI